MRKIIYTTNAIESLNRVIRKTAKTRGSFLTDEAATKLIYLAIRNFETKGRVVREWPLGDCRQSPAGNSCSKEPVRYSNPRTVQQMTRFNPMGQPPYTVFQILPSIVLFPYKFFMVTAPTSFIERMIPSKYKVAGSLLVFACKSDEAESTGGDLLKD